jgi:hypothetical protein
VGKTVALRNLSAAVRSHLARIQRWIPLTEIGVSALKHVLRALILLGLVASVSACACRPGYVGPYGGVHPGRCVVY